MAPRLRVFLDTSVLFAAVLSPEGGLRMVLKLGEAGLVGLLVGPTVLAELDDVVARKAPESRPLLAVLLDAAGVEVGPAPSRKHLANARRCVAHAGDAAVLADAMAAEAGWLLTHDKRHLLRAGTLVLPLTIGTPGDLIAYLREHLLASE
jgi:predicted nucleic acid-binding protein